MSNNDLATLDSKCEHPTMCNDKCDINKELLTKMIRELDEFTKLTAACLSICKNVEETVNELKKEVEEVKDTQRWMVKHR